MIKIICVGKIKEKFFTDGISEYSKRIKGYTKFEIVEVKEVNTPEINKNIELEGENILSKVSDQDYCVTLEIKGKKSSSEELASFIEKSFTYGNSNISFIIGGSNGLSKAVTTRSNYALSFSDMTFPHQLMRLILTEQIYRAFAIINHSEYHK